MIHPGLNYKRLQVTSQIGGIMKNTPPNGTISQPHHSQSIDRGDKFLSLNWVNAIFYPKTGKDLLMNNDAIAPLSFSAV
ncbi:hypothetical protein SAMD00079811_55640 [Scytonema sp. HK-05]|nr:hypothetical protein SAMD00079811_55640 [Scytonema sp. HK-05]